jgi:hypothetical protein
MNKTNLKKEYSARIKAWKVANPKVTRGMRLSSDSKAEAVRIAAIGKLASIGQASTCKRLGISHGTLWNWSKLGQSHPAATVVAVPVPVRLTKPKPKATIELTLSNGVKVTGITVEQAAVLLMEMV